MTRNNLLFLFIGLLLLVGIVSAETENIVVVGGFIAKGPTGVLIPLGFETFVDGPGTMYLYNMLAVSIIMFIAAMSGPRSEAAFCIVIPIVAGIMELFGWLRLATTTATNGLIALTVIMGVLGVMIYMKDQNRQQFGTMGPGSPLINICVYLICFSAALTLISGFSIFPIGPQQPIPGTCTVGLPCDAYNNIDWQVAVSSISHSGGLLDGIVSAVAGLTAAVIAGITILINIAFGILVFPAVLTATVNGIFPGIGDNALWQAFMVLLWVIIGITYIFGWRELTSQSQSPGGSI